MNSLRQSLEAVRRSAAPARAKGRAGGRQRTWLIVAMAVGAAAGAVVLAAIGFWTWVATGLPKVPDQAALWALNRPPGVTFVDRKGDIVAVRGPYHGRRVELGTVPRHVWEAFIAIEDRRFWDHTGVDRQAIMRAAFANLSAGDIVQGGSTLSQQLAKNLFLTRDQTVRRKLQEMVLAARIEESLSKQEILELYLNTVYLGDQAYGVDAAARRYFGKPAAQLTVAQAAMLAGLPKAPSQYAPNTNFPAARERQLVVLDAMLDAGMIDRAERTAAAEEEITIAPDPPAEGEWGYVYDMALAEARRRTGDDCALEEDGCPAGYQYRQPDLIIQLTLDPELQRTAVAAVQRNLGAMGRHPTRPLQGAMVVMDTTGAVRALVGGSSYNANKFNRVTQARRQPGSSFKTFVYAAAFEQGMDPETIRMDEPIEINGWRPKNYDEGYRGAVTLQSAFAQSLNTVAVSIADEIGQQRVIDLARRFGVSTPLEPVPSLALGAYEVTMWDMAQGFAVFMNEGRRVQGHVIDRIENARGDVLFAFQPGEAPVVYAPELARLMNAMMKKVVDDGTGTRAKLRGRDAAGKTGTSQDWRDAWFVGYTADYTAAVWIGYDDFTRMPRITGGATPAEIWSDVMEAAHRGLPARPIPSATLRARGPRDADQARFYSGLAAEFSRRDQNSVAEAPPPRYFRNR